MPNNVKVAPSILAADFIRLGEQIAAAEAAGADQIHVDIMDGHFVPNLSMGPAVVQAVRRVTQLPLDVHLMVTQPDHFLEPFSRAGANALTFHVEIAENATRTIDAIHHLGLRAGIAVKPSSALEPVEVLLPALDIVLVMTVEPGFGGQKFLDVSVDRVARIRADLDRIGSNADLSVDGGIDRETASRVVRAGATVLIAGSAIFRGEDGIGASLRGLRDAAAG
jgi:ribulose-phosphate 3-epimerase